MYQNPNPGNNGVLGGATVDPTQRQQQQQQLNMNYNGMPQQSQAPPPQQQQQQQQQQCQQTSKNVRKKPYVKITEQPAGKALRFRYECEGRSAGSIPGVNSTPENKTYPTIEIVGYKGRAVVVVSCVTKDTPYRPHPHNLVGKEGCKKGVCTLEINSETMRAVFSNLGIQCVKKKDIEAALKAREEIRVDPFKTGFSHRFQPSSIDLNSVRLCFQVFTESDPGGRFTQPLPPVVSEPIFDKKAMFDLVICRLCSCSASVLGNTQIILLCEKVAKEDISVRFFEEDNGHVVWEALGEFQHTDVHKQTAITFKTPRYHTLDITEPAKVFIQLRRPSDGVTSEPLPFEYVPLDSDPAHLRRKRQKTGGDPMHLLLQQQQIQHQNDHNDGRQTNNMPCWNAANIPAIKTEPRDTSPQPYGLMYRTKPELTPSPQPLSPSNTYNAGPNAANGNNTAAASTYNLAAVPATKAEIISPNHPFGAGNGANPANGNGPGGGGQGGGGGTPNDDVAPSAMDIHDFSGYPHQAQQQPPPQQQQHQQHHAQHHQQHHGMTALAGHPHQQQQQQYSSTNPFGNAGAAHWEERMGGGGGPNANATNNNTNPSQSQNPSNLNATNPFTMHNLLTHNNNGNGNAAHWNLNLNHMMPHHQQQQQHHMHQQQQQLHAFPHQNGQSTNDPQNGAGAGAAPGGGPSAANGQTDHGPTLSNLLSFDSEQLVRINSEDQQMLRLNSEDLQISNLSIST